MYHKICVTKTSYFLLHLQTKSFGVYLKKYFFVQIVPGAGHHVYADNIDTFNSIVNKAGEIADKLFYKKWQKNYVKI